MKDITEISKKSKEIEYLNSKLKSAFNQIRAKNETLTLTLKRLKDSQAQVLQSEKMASVGQLAAGVAHEINNPTGFVSSNLKTLAEYQEDIAGIITEYRGLFNLLRQEEQEKLWSKLPTLIRKITELEDELDIDFILNDVPDLIRESHEGAERIKKIVMDLKDFAHPGEDTMQTADINHCIESTLNVIWNELKYKAEVIRDFDALPMVVCFPQQLNQVFMNILVNAAQAMEEKGEILISTRGVNGNAEIAIRDNGPGIPEENLSQIFDPFFTTKDVGKGTGLGLNIVYNIVKKHDGSIDVKSRVGEGTTFTIRIPFEPGKDSGS
jgi:signal transduction histidine kinase